MRLIDIDRLADMLVIADALQYLAKDIKRHPSDRARAEKLRKQILEYEASMCHSADRQTGEWIPIIKENKFGKAYQTGIYCSECGKMLSCETNFYPNCGADMKGENHD